MSIQSTSSPCNIHGYFHSKLKIQPIENNLVVSNKTELENIAKQAGFKGKVLDNLRTIDLTTRDIILLYTSEGSLTDYTGVTNMTTTAEKIQLTVANFYLDVGGGWASFGYWLVLSKPKDHKEVIVEHIQLNDIFTEPEFEGIENTDILAGKLFDAYYLLDENERKWAQRQLASSQEEWEKEPVYALASPRSKQCLENYIELYRREEQNKTEANKRLAQLRLRVCGRPLEL
jgi:hypothetical protein